MTHESTDRVITRRDARERAMQVLYAYELSHEPIELLVESIAGSDLEREPEHLRFAQALVYTTVNHRPEYDELLRGQLDHWDLSRVAILDLIVLRLGLTEFLHFEDIPSKVTINEYVEIAKRYSTANSGRFVNGMLDAALRVLTESGRIAKSGRGLISH